MIQIIFEHNTFSVKKSIFYSFSKNKIKSLFNRVNYGLIFIIK